MLNDRYHVSIFENIKRALLLLSHFITSQFNRQLFSMRVDMTKYILDFFILQNSTKQKLQVICQFLNTISTIKYLLWLIMRIKKKCKAHDHRRTSLDVSNYYSASLNKWMTTSRRRKTLSLAPFPYNEAMANHSCPCLLSLFVRWNVTRVQILSCQYLPRLFPASVQAVLISERPDRSG